MSEPLNTYTFLPWLRQGIVSQITQADTLGREDGPIKRASVSVAVTVNDEEDCASGAVQLVGPGDVVGINPRAVVRTEPRPGISDFEPNYLAFIEFYDEHFPWRYTPARAVELAREGDDYTSVDNAQQTKLRPWLYLMVLAEDEFKSCVPPNGPLPVVTLKGETNPEAIFPPADQSWAWAHVHVSGDITKDTPQDTMAALESLVGQNPDHALSRLICPRKLQPRMKYQAFVIPAFEIGRLAGLGQSIPEDQDTLAPAWGGDQTKYPVYYQWQFHTGVRGDFEYLVRLLEARSIPEQVGIRPQDMQEPNFGVSGMRDGPHDEPTMGLEGALKSPDTEFQPAEWPPADRANYPPFLTELEAKINLQEDLQNPPEGGEGHPDPVISPPLYGRWHAMQRRLNVSQDGWVNELNRDPRYRVAAGLGAQVIRTNQEDYMARAWAQLGDVLAANQKIRQAQLALSAGYRIRARHLLPLSEDQQVAVTRAVHARVMNGESTLHHQVANSRLPQAAFSSAFRRMTRPRGRVMRKALPESSGRPTDLLIQLNEGRITAAPPKQPPERQISLDRLRLEELTTEAVDRIPPRPNFEITELGWNVPPDIIQPGNQDNAEAGKFRSALRDLHARFETNVPQPEPGPPLNMSEAAGNLIEALNPAYTIPRRIRSIIPNLPQIKYVRPSETIVPVMAHPVFPDPMYKPLRDRSSELLIPNLNLIPNNTLTLLETNPKFIEAYMVGCNHEMARELLWREYPTDQRGSYFRQFWDTIEIINREEGKPPDRLEEEQRDIIPLHHWLRPTPLGSHSNRPMPTGGESDETRLVLVIRGDLLKRYPTAVIYAQKAKWVDNDDGWPPKIRELDNSNPEQNIKEPIFKAEIVPDLHFLGFNLTESQVKGAAPSDVGEEPGEPGWFFVIQERPGEPRFGLDTRVSEEESLPNITTWNETTWSHIGDPESLARIDLGDFETNLAEGNFAMNITEDPDKNIKWSTNAADMAYILYQAPVMVAVHASDMLE